VAVDSRILAVFLWTTFFTSVWVWVYFVAQQLTRLVSPIRRVVALLQYLLPLEQRPLRSVGAVMALVGCVGYWAVMLPLGTSVDEAAADALEPEMVTLAVGAFNMGSPDEEEGRDVGEGPQHLVYVEAFAISRYEVTFEEYDRFARATGRLLPGDQFWGRGKRPVVEVSWHDAKAYAAWLSEQTGKRYRLPTEAEWEYAARAGTTTARFWGEAPEEGECKHANVFDTRNESALRERFPVITWTASPCEDAHAYTAPAGQFEANAFGLHDMLGNVWEWVEDCWHGSYENPPEDASTAWLEADGGDCGRRVVRGGSWGGHPRGVRSAHRNGGPAVVRGHDIGFRLAQDL
jgi:formylglycine-generating enzyme required for sulfatase activity